MRRSFAPAALMAALVSLLLLIGAAPASAQFRVTGATNPDGSTVVATFSADVDPATGGTAGNYAVFEKDNLANRFLPTTATVSGSQVTLALPGSLTSGTVYTLQVSSAVENTSGQAISSTGRTVDFTATGPDATPPTVSGAAALSADTVEVTFSEAVDAATAEDTGAYVVYPTASPGSPVGVSAASLSGAVATLTLASPLTSGTEYTVEVSDVEDLAGNVIGTPSSAAFTWTETNLTSIATIQADPTSYVGQTVTVEGVVYIPTDYRGSTVSGYLQDASGRGINLFGTGMDVAALQSVGNRVRITAEVDQYFTTTELVNPTDVTLLGTASRPAPEVLSTGAAANAQWEGTFIEVTGPITAQAVGGPGVNYTVNDGSGPIVVRVVDALGAPAFSNGTTITARGAGGQFGSDFQVNVGLASDVFAGSASELSVSGAFASSATSVDVSFNLAVDATTGGNAANYSVRETASPASTVPVSSATVSGSTVTLALGASLTDGTGYTVQVSGVEGAGGEALGSGDSATFTYSESNATPIATIQADPESYVGQTVTVEGVVYIPTDYRGSTVSGYIQDASGRGINLFGSGMDVAALQSVGNRVRITAEVDLYFTTTELVNPTEVTLLGTAGRPAPEALSTGAAANAQWEGTFIEVTGPITAQAVGGPGVNYTVNDGSGPIIVRVVDTLGAPTFTNGTTITARGAGGQFGSDFQVLVGLAGDVSSGSATALAVTGASASNATSVRVSFNKTVDATTGGTASNYSVYPTASPGSTLPVSSASVSGATVTLALGSSLSQGTGYTVEVSGVTDSGGGALGSSNSATFTWSGIQTTPIATIQADPESFVGQTVTVEGVVFVPTDYRGTTTSGYLQDDSGRGINIFGSGMDVPALQTVGNLVRITAEVDLYFTTTELLNPTSVTLVQAGVGRPAPAQLSTGDAASPSWEGTFIQVSGEVTDSAVAGPGLNYTVNDGSGPIIVRVVDTLGADAFSVGQTITARGAGGQFGADFQVNVGLATDIFEGQDTEDRTPPRITRASAESNTSVLVDFNEAVDPTTAQEASNYEVFRTGSPGTTAQVSSAVLDGSNPARVRLGLAESIDLQQDWTLRVRNVQDLAGNAIPATGATAAIQPLLVDAVEVSGPPYTFLPRDGETYPITVNVTTAVAEGSSGAGVGSSQVILRIFGLDGRLVKTLVDTRVRPAPFQDNRLIVSWDGTDEQGEWVPAGAYVAHLQVRGPVNDGVQNRQIPVVVASRLDR